MSQTGDIRFRLTVDGAQQVSAEVRRVEGSLQQLSGGVRQAAQSAGALLALPATMAAAAVAFVRTADQITVLSNQLQLATGSASAAGAAYESLFGIAQRSRVSFTELGSTFAAISRASGQLGLSQAKLLTVTEAIGNAMAISGGSAAGMQAALVQLGQGMASGTLRGEELNSVMEQTPRLAQAIADGLGVTLGQLRQLGQDGRLTAEAVVNALESQAAVLAGEVKDSVVTVGQAMTQLGNAATKLVGQLDQASGATRGVSGAAQAAANDLGRLSAVMKEAEQSGAGFVDQLAAAAGLALARSAFGLLGSAAGGLNAAINTLTGGLAGLNENVDVMPRWLESNVRQSEILAGKLGKANAELAALYQRARENPESIYIKSAIADTERYIATLNKAKTARDNLQGGGAGRGSVNPETVGQSAAREAADQARTAEQLNAIRNKAAGVNKEWVQSLRELDALQAKGAITEQQRISLAQQLTAATYKAKEETVSTYQQLGTEIAKVTREIEARAAAGGKLTKAQELELSLAEKIAAASRKLSAGEVNRLKADAARAVAAQRQADDAEEAIKRAQQQVRVDAEMQELREKGEAEIAAWAARRQQQFAAEEAYAAGRLQAAQDDVAATALARAANISLAEAVQQVALQRMEAARAALVNDPEALASLDRQIARQRELAALVSQQVGADALQGLFDASAVQNFASEFEAAFGRAGGAVATLIGTLDEYGVKQQELARLGAEAARQGPEAQARFAQVAAQQQIRSYGDMASAAKKFFKEGSTGYKTLEATEKAFRAVELGLAIKTAAEKLGLITSITAAKVAGDAAQAASATASVGPEVAAAMAKGQANAVAGVANQAGGDPYTAFFRMAAMAAIMAALGFAVKGSGSGAPMSAAERQKANGTGTVLGDAEAKSQSIANSIDRLADTARIGLTYQSGMLAALRNIEAALAGVGTQVLRSGGINTGKNLGITEGVIGTAKGDALLGLMGIDDSALVKSLGPVGSILGKVQSLWGKTKQEIVDAGLSIQGTVGSLSAGQGVRQYADVQTTKSSFFGLKKDKSFDTQFAAVEASVAQQFGLVFQNIGNILQSSAVQLGKDGQAVAAAVAGFTVDISRLSLKDLKGDELQEALAVAIGAQADTIAATVLPGLDAFQKVGEGYFETLVRVSSGVEEAAYQLDLLGVSTVSFGDVVRKQGDVGSEVVRQSIAAAESVGGVLSSVGQIINTLDGSAEELAGAYRQLVDVRYLLRGVGVDGDALSTGMIRGAGGLDQLGESLSTYLDGFFSETERTAAGMARLGEEFARLGFDEMPTTREAFRALVESIDPTTDSGARLFAQMVGLSDSFAALIPAAEDAARSLSDIASERYGLETTLLQLQGNTAELRRRELEKIDPSNRGLQEEIWRLEDMKAAQQAWNNTGSAASSAASSAQSAWESVWKSMGDEIRRLRGGSGAQAAAALQREFAIATAAARAGDIEAAKKLPGLSKQLSDDALKTARTRTEADIAQSRLAASLETTLRATNATDEHLQGLRVDVQAMHADVVAALAQVAGQARQTTKLLQQFNIDGMPEVRT